MHHVTIDLLRQSYLRLKRNAAAGVDGVTWHGYGDRTEATVGAPVRATMDTVEVGRTPDGVPVFMDALGYAADAVVVVNRLKPHTTFRGPIESGPT